MALHWLNDSVILAIFLFCYFLRRLWRDYSESRRFKQTAAAFLELGLGRTLEAPTSGYGYKRLRTIISLAGVDDWVHCYDKIHGHSITTRKDDLFVCGGPLFDDHERVPPPPRQAAIFHYLTTFNPQLVEHLIHRLQTFEFIVRTMQAMAPEKSVARKVIEFCTAHHDFHWDRRSSPPLDPESAKGIPP